jgi:hypothetical protein
VARTGCAGTTNMATEPCEPIDFTRPPRVSVVTGVRVTDPVSWLQIEKGWNVVTADGTALGAVFEITGDENADIFDGLAIKSKRFAPALYVPAEQVGEIVPGEVRLKITSAEADALQPFTEPPVQEKILPGKAPLGRRVSNWLRGNR